MRKKVIITFIAILVILSIVIIGIVQIEKSKISVLRDKSLSFNENLDIPSLIPFKKNNKWGFSNRSKVVVEPKFEWVGLPDNSDKYLMVRNNGLCGVINLAGERIVPFIYDELDFNENGTNQFIAKHNGLCGIINLSGEKIVPFIYDKLDFVENFTDKFIAQKGDYFGVIDSLNKVLFPFKYIKIESVDRNFVVGEKMSNGTLYSLLDSNGRKVLNNLYYDIFSRPERNPSNLFIVSKKIEVDKNHRLFPWDKTRRVLGCVDIKGNVIVPLKYTKIEICGKYFIVSDYDDLRIPKVSNGYGVYDKNGNVLIPLIYNGIKHFVKIGKGLFVCYKYPKVKLVDSLNQTIIPYRYNNIYDMNNRNNQTYAFAMEGYLYGILNLDGEVTVPFAYTSLLDPDNSGMIAAKKNMKAGFIDYNNNVLISFDYEDVGDFNEGLTLVKKISPEYIKGNLRVEGKTAANASWFSDYVGQGKLYTDDEFYNGMKNLTFRQEFYDRIIKYDKRFGSFEEFDLCMTLGDWRKKIPGKYGFIDIKGKVKTKLIYDEAKDFKNGFAEVCINNKWGVINKDGKIVIPIKYDTIRRVDKFKDLFAIYRKGNLGSLGIYDIEFTGFIDVNGVEYFN